MSAFQNGLSNGTLINKWTQKPPRNVNEMFAITNNWADGEEAEKEQLSEFKVRWEEENWSHLRPRDVEARHDHLETSRKGE